MTAIKSPGFLTLSPQDVGATKSPTFGGLFDLGRIVSTGAACGFVQTALFAHSELERADYAASFQLIVASVSDAAQARTPLVDASDVDAIRSVCKPYSHIELVDLFKRAGIVNKFGGVPANRYEAILLATTEIGKRLFEASRNTQ